jgi:hypothetical protein
MRVAIAAGPTEKLTSPERIDALHATRNILLINLGRISPESESVSIANARIKRIAPLVLDDTLLTSTGQ